MISRAFVLQVTFAVTDRPQAVYNSMQLGMQVNSMPTRHLQKCRDLAFTGQTSNQFMRLSFPQETLISACLVGNMCCSRQTHSNVQVTSSPAGHLEKAQEFGLYWIAS